MPTSDDTDDVLLRLLLEPAGATVKLAWLVWYHNNDATIVERLRQLIRRLEQATANRRSRLLAPARQLLAYAHETMGKVAFDRLDFATATGHFLEMQQLGEALDDRDVLVLAATHHGDLLRRRGRYHLATQRLSAAAPTAKSSSASAATEGLRLQVLARAHAEFGAKDAFLAAIEGAEDKATEVTPDALELGSQFTITSVRHERAHGHTLLWEPATALDIYAETRRHAWHKPPLSLRDSANFMIIEAQAHAYAGSLDVGVPRAIEGLKLARLYGSARHVSRVQRMYDRLRPTPAGASPELRDLKEALHTP